MKNALRVVRAAMVDPWDNLFLVVFSSLVWLFLILLIVPGPPAALRRAARWEGWAAADTHENCGQTKSPERLAEQLAAIRQHRASDAPFDVTMHGCTTPADRALVRRFNAVCRQPFTALWTSPLSSPTCNANPSTRASSSTWSRLRGVRPSTAR